MVLDLLIPDLFTLNYFVKSLKLHDLILSFYLLSRTNISAKTFSFSLSKALILCDFLNLG